MIDLMSPAPRILSVPALALAAIRDARTYSPQAALARLSRKWAARGHEADIAALVDLAPYRTHLHAIDPGDPLFFLSHRHYMIKDLSRAERVAAALHHYRTEAAQFMPAYHAMLGDAGGLTLWSETHADIGYSIRLTPAQDVLYEGGISLVLMVGDARIAVLSYAWLAPGIGGSPLAAPLITRKQMTQERGHQAAFNKAFDRATPAHLLLSAFESIARVCGHQQALGLTMARHPATSPEIASLMATAYDQFWADLGGVPLAGPEPAALRFELPLALRPLDDLTSAHRRRALIRRAHLERIGATVKTAISPLVRLGQADRR